MTDILDRIDAWAKWEPGQMTVYVIFDEDQPHRPVVLVTTSKEKAERLCTAEGSPFGWECHPVDDSN